MSIVIGLTGPTGSGKSSASNAAADFGFQVIDCDKSAREAVEKGTPGLKALTVAFGDGILTPDGTLDRKALASLAFKDRESTELLNKTLLPFVAELVVSRTADKNTLLDAPTLFESGINRICTKTVAVLGLTIKEADLRINAGKTDEFYKENADYIIYNNGDEEAFLKRFTEIMKEITGGNL